MGDYEKKTFRWLIFAFVLMLLGPTISFVAAFVLVSQGGTP